MKKYTFSEKIKILSKKNKVTIEELAKGSGVPYHTIVSIRRKRDRMQVPLLMTVIKLSRYFNMTIDEILKDVDLGF